MIKCLELFSGNADITNAFRNNGIMCISVDWEKNIIHIYVQMFMV